MAIQTITPNTTQPLGLPNTGTGTDEGDTWGQVATKLNAMFVELYGASTYTGLKTFPAGAGTATYGAAGTISRAVTTIGSSATNTTQTLLSYTLPANTLNANGASILVTAWGRKGANAAPVTLALNIGGASINTGAGTQNGVSWMLTGQAFRAAANSQQEVYTAQVGAVLTAVKSTSDTSVDTGTIAISVTALDASAAQSNVLLDGLVVEYFA